MLPLLASLGHVTVRRVGMMSCFFMASCLVVFGCFGVMASGVSVMLGGGLMMFSCFLGHRNISLIGIVITAVAGSTQPIRLLPYRSSNERFGFTPCRSG